MPALMLELVVVVSGIFLGLQADQWNDRRVENQLEADYLKRLYAELVAGLEAHLGSIVRQFEQELSIHELIAERVAFALNRVTPYITYYNDPPRAELDPEAVGTTSLQRTVREIPHQTFEHRFTYQRQVTRTCKLVDRPAPIVREPGTTSSDFIESNGLVPACRGE